jgi:RNA polymerase sigma factor (sigma-70 family)
MAAMDQAIQDSKSSPSALTNEAWGELYERFGRYVLAILRRYVSPIDLDDVAHDFWCHVREKFADSFKDGDVKAWIATAASRKGLDWAKRKRPERWNDERDIADGRHGGVLEGLIHTEEEHQRAEALSKCVDALTPEERSLLTDRVAGKKSAQIAAARGVSPAREAKEFFTIKARLQDCIGRSLR